MQEADNLKISLDHQIDCDSIVYSIGVTPNISLVNNTPIQLNKGIVVNEKMETNIESERVAKLIFMQKLCIKKSAS